VKVLRDPTKKDSKGNPQGKGIAFAEFSDPEHALCALRQLNNNPAPFGKPTFGNAPHRSAQCHAFSPLALFIAAMKIFPLSDSTAVTSVAYK
jgi:hypothetical protein